MRAVTRAAPTQVVRRSHVDFGADVTVVLNASDCKAFIFQDGACYLKDQINHPRDCMSCLGVNFEEPVGASAHGHSDECRVVGAGRQIQS